MKIYGRQHMNDYYHNDLDLPPHLLRKNASRHKAKLKRIAAKARRRIAKSIVREEMREDGNG